LILYKLLIHTLYKSWKESLRFNFFNWTLPNYCYWW